MHDCKDIKLLFQNMVYDNIFSIQQEIMNPTVYSIEYNILLLEK